MGRRRRKGEGRDGEKRLRRERRPGQRQEDRSFDMNNVAFSVPRSRSRSAVLVAAGEALHRGRGGWRR